MERKELASAWAVARVVGIRNVHSDSALVDATNFTVGSEGSEAGIKVSLFN